MRKLIPGLVISICLALLAGFVQPAAARQVSEARRAIDLIILLDNSCSMFPRHMIPSQCGDSDSDPNFLRIVGADLFLARLGFSEINESDYQVGVVGFGEQVTQYSPLQPVEQSRDNLAQKIANPRPEGATRLLDGLQAAYQEMRNSPNRKPANLPAIVVMTDGVPWPRGEQPVDQIEALVKANPDIPVFIMLLQDPDKNSNEYDDYIRFWRRLQANNSHVTTYEIAQPDQIEETYNQIIAELQNTIPSRAMRVSPSQPLSVYVSPYVQKIIITVLNPLNAVKGQVTVTDSKGQVISPNDQGVDWFTGAINPVETATISAPRLSKELKDAQWQIASTQEVKVILDILGAYRVNFTNPAVNLGNITNRYSAIGQQTPKQPLNIQFNLLDETGQPILEPQPIQGAVILPDGQKVHLPVPPNLTPDAAGLYTLPFDFVAAYPAIASSPGRFTIQIDAGSADNTAPQRVPIAQAQLLVDVGNGPHLANTDPQVIDCTSSTSQPVSVQVGDYALAAPNSVQVTVFGGGKDVVLTDSGSGAFAGDLAPLCQALLANIPCGTQSTLPFQIRMTAQMADGSPLQAMERVLPAQAAGAACPQAAVTLAATVTKIPGVTPTAPAPVVQDQDNDGIPDAYDKCPTQGGFATFGGCGVPAWLWGLLAVIILGLLALFYLFIFPWFKVNFISPPPKGYVLICRQGDPMPMARSIYSVGMSRRVSRVTIGGNQKKDTIYVKGLAPSEFVVEKQGDSTVLISPKNPGKTFKDLPDMISTSQNIVTIKFGLDQTKLRC